MNKTIAFDGITPLQNNSIAYPCGLIAKSVFTDYYNISTSSEFNSQIYINESNIAWKSDVEYKFKNQAGNWQQTQWTDVENGKKL